VITPLVSKAEEEPFRSKGWEISIKTIGFVICIIGLGRAITSGALNTCSIASGPAHSTGSAKHS